MALMYNMAERDIDIRGTLHLKTGVNIALSAANIVSYSIDERSASSGFSLGEAQAAGFDLVIDDTAHAITPLNVVGATVQVEIGIKSGESYAYSPFGFWYVESATLSKQSAIATLKGSDALASRFDAVWSDAKGNYPRTLGALATAVCSGTGVTLKSATFLNSTISISSLPKWPSGTTRRGVIGYIAACAGGFARIDRSGQLEFVKYNAASVGTVDSNTYRSLETGTGARFDFNCVGVRPVGKDAFTRYAIDTGRADTAASALQVDENPLCTATIANAIKAALTGFASDGIVLDWVGDPSVKPGDLLTIEDTDETAYLLVVNGQTITFDGGLSAITRAELATETASSSGYVVNDSVLTAKGFLNGRKLSIESVQTDSLAAQVITAEKMAAGSITAENAAIAEAAIKKANIETATIESLIADSITALKGRFGDIIADKTVTDELYADMAKITVLMAEQITAETITTDELYAELARITTLQVKQITAETIETDELYAALAKVIVLRAEQAKIGSAEIDELRAALAEIVRLDAKFAEIDYLNVKFLDSNEAIFRLLTGGKVAIDRLSVQQAQIVDAVIGSLTLVDNDGKMYKIGIDETGNLTATYTGTQDEAFADGALPEGYRAVASSLTVGDVDAGRIVATEATFIDVFASTIVVSMLTASEAFISKLFASEAVIDHLKTYDIRNDDRITLTVGGVRKMILQATEAGIRFGRNDSDYNILIDDDSIDFLQTGSLIAQLRADLLWAKAMAADRYIKVGGATLEWSDTTGFSLTM